VVSTVAILVAVFNSDVARVLLDKARASLDDAARTQSPAARQILLKDDPAHASDPVTRGDNTNAPRSGTEARKDMATDYSAAPQSGAPAARPGNEGAAPSKAPSTVPAV
jgi:hypothetical protein